MTKLDHLQRTLDRHVTKRTSFNADSAERCIKYGAGYQQAWMQDAMREDAKGIIAQLVIDAIGRGASLEAVEADLAHRFEQEVSFIIPTNSDTQAKIYMVQALQAIRNEVRYALMGDAD